MKMPFIIENYEEVLIYKLLPFIKRTHYRGEIHQLDVPYI
jgi:hypothetical protein